MNPVATQAARFLVVGGLATAVHIVTALGLHHFARMAPHPSNLVAFLVACCVSYFGNWLWTFGSVSDHGYALPRFLIVAISGFCVNQLVVFLIVDILHHPFWIAIIPAVAVVPAVTFWLNRTRVFLARN